MSLFRYNINNIILTGGSSSKEVAYNTLNNEYEICFLLTLDLSKTSHPMDGHNFNFIKFKLSPKANDLAGNDCCVQIISQKLNEIYITFKLLDVQEVIESARRASHQKIIKTETGIISVYNEPVREDLIDKLVNYINSKKQQPINVYSSEFILETGMFLDRRLDNCLNYTTLLNIQKTKILKQIIPEHINQTVMLEQISVPSQPESYYFKFPSIKFTSSKYKIHISIKPEFTNQAIVEIMKYIVQTKHTKLSRFISRMKIQNPSPASLYESPMWNGWEQVVKDHPAGIGYIVIYPSLRMDGDQGKKFIECLNHFKTFWKTHFEDKYPAAMRDGNYLRFNERISDTIYFAHGVDTKTRLEALENIEKRGPFKPSEKIYKYLDEYCKETRSIASKQSILNCLKNNFNIDNINCESLRSEPLKDVDVWLQKVRSNDLYGISECDISDEDMNTQTVSPTIDQELTEYISENPWLLLLLLQANNNVIR